MNRIPNLHCGHFCNKCFSNDLLSWCSNEKFFFCRNCNYTYSKKGKMIVLEGLDGSGKSTYIDLLFKYYESIGKKVKIFKLPNDERVYGHLIRSRLSNKISEYDDPILDQLYTQSLFMLERFVFKDEVEQYLHSDYIVLFDRYSFSTVAYFLAVRENYFKTKGKFLYLNGMQSKTLFNTFNLMEYQENKIPNPDLTLFIETGMDVISKRLAKRESKEVFDMDIDFLKIVYKYYKWFESNNFRFFKINKFWNKNFIIKKLVKEIDSI